MSRVTADFVVDSVCKGSVGFDTRSREVFPKPAGGKGNCTGHMSRAQVLAYMGVQVQLQYNPGPIRVSGRMHEEVRKGRTRLRLL